MRGSKTSWAVNRVFAFHCSGRTESAGCENTVWKVWTTYCTHMIYKVKSYGCSYRHFCKNKSLVMNWLCIWKNGIYNIIFIANNLLQLITRYASSSSLDLNELNNVFTAIKTMTHRKNHKVRVFMLSQYFSFVQLCCHFMSNE